MMYDIYHRILGLFVAAILVALVARRLRLPYTVGLVAAGVALSMLPLQGGALLTHDLIFELMLPPLLFEAALFIHWHELQRDVLIVLALAIFGVVITAAVVAGGLWAALGWPIGAAAVFGVLIAATDPVAVIALFKDLGVTGRLRFLVETESLLNDGVAAVLFGLALAWVSADGDTHLSAFGIAQTFLVSAGGGTLIGLACAGIGILLAWGTTDPLVETGLTVAVAYGSFYLAEDLHVSGVLATVAAGILMGNLGIMRDSTEITISKEGRTAVLAFWEFAAFLANSIVFLLIGLAVADSAVAPGADQAGADHPAGDRRPCPDRLPDRRRLQTHQARHPHGAAARALVGRPTWRAGVGAGPGASGRHVHAARNPGRHLRRSGVFGRGPRPDHGPADAVAGAAVRKEGPGGGPRNPRGGGGPPPPKKKV